MGKKVVTTLSQRDLFLLSMGLDCFIDNNYDIARNDKQSEESQQQARSNLQQAYAIRKKLATMQKSCEP
jgi:hypothetical protein